MKIRDATEKDIEHMVGLSYKKRRFYEKAQPQFWKYADGAEEIQSDWFKELLHRDDHILLVAEKDTIKGFVIARLLEAPEVYNPGGLTLMIDDFCVENSGWNDIGMALLKEARKQGKAKGASQVLVVSGAHDDDKVEFLKREGLHCASHWYVAGV